VNPSLKIEEKKQVVEDLHEKFSRSTVIIVTDYKGLNVTEMNDLRGKLKDVDIEYQVVKNTLIIRAAEGTDASLLKASYTGPSAVALSYDDPVSPAKVLTAFAKEHKALEIKAGVLKGQVLDLNAINALSALPSRDQLLSQLLSVIIGVPTAFVRALNDVPKRLLNVLQSVKEQKAA
jgi:large subunit ribosomal protein L10